MTTLDRLTEKIKVLPNGCWEWTGAKCGNGYASCTIGRVCGQSVHRVIYEMVNGPIPDGLQLDHLCRNRACVNPDHLEPVTLKENVLRGNGPTAVNSRKTHCKRGHPLEGDNLYVFPKGNRACKTCMEASRQKHRPRKNPKGSYNWKSKREDCEIT